MSKKEEAFELFSQGKGIDDPEVVALGLKKDTLERYYQEWEKPGQTLEEPVEEPAPEPEPVPEPVPVVTTLLLNWKLMRVENGVIVGEVEEEEVA